MDNNNMLPSDFTSRVMDAILAESLKRKHIHSVWQMIMYSLVSAATLSAIIFLLSFYEIISFVPILDTFHSIAVLLNNSLFKGIQVLASNQLLLVICCCIFILMAAGEMISHHIYKKSFAK